MILKATGSTVTKCIRLNHDGSFKHIYLCRDFHSCGLHNWVELLAAHLTANARPFFPSRAGVTNENNDGWILFSCLSFGLAAHCHSVMTYWGTGIEPSYCYCYSFTPLLFLQCLPWKGASMNVPELAHLNGMQSLILQTILLKKIQTAPTGWSDNVSESKIHYTAKSIGSPALTHIWT